MREIKAFILNNMKDYPLYKIEDYIYSFYADGEISIEECDNLFNWVKITLDI